MTLTLSEQYVAKTSLYLYNQIIDIQFYSLLYRMNPLIVAWDSRNDMITQIFGPWDEEKGDKISDLHNIILSFIEENGLTDEN